MKKTLLLFIIACFMFPAFINAQQLYSNSSTIQGSIPGSQLGSQILFDDIEVPDGSVLSADSINITQIKISVDRVNAEADTYTLYYSPLNESGTGSAGDPSYFTVPPTLVSSVTIPATQAIAYNTTVVFGDSVHTLFSLKVPSKEILTGQKTFFIGVQYSSTTQNGWNFTDGSQSPNIGGGPGGLWLYSAPSTVDTSSIAVAINGNVAFYYTMAAQAFGFMSSLPVTITSFDGVLKNNIAVLEWNTSREYNNKGFEIEKSNDGQNFAGIGFVAGKGTTANSSNYTFSDPKMISGNNYYRLKQIDLDGKFNYSSVIDLQFNKFAWSVLGNPSSNTSIQLQLDKQYNNVSLQLVSLDGKVMQTINKGSLSQGTYSVPLNLNNMAAGMYVVRLMVDGQNFSKEIIK